MKNQSNRPILKVSGNKTWMPIIIFVSTGRNFLIKDVARLELRELITREHTNKDILLRVINLSANNLACR